MNKTATDNTTRHTQLFILGTGRCGTKTLAHMFSALPGARVVHEIDPMLLYELRDYLEGDLAEHDLLAIIKRTREPQAIGGDRLSGESNQRLSFILPQLKELFPEARYLWLTRDGRENVASMHHRHWYHPREAQLREAFHKPSAETRLQGDIVGDMSSEQWEQLDPFARCCWYWSYTNRHIPQQAAKLDLPLMHVRLEDLQDKLVQIMTFLNLSDLNPPVMRKSNTALAGKPLPWSSWSPKQVATFETLAGDVMDEHYPGWREQIPQRDADDLATKLNRGSYRIRQIGHAIRNQIKKHLHGNAS